MIRWLIVRMKKCGCILSAKEPERYQLDWIERRSVGEVLRHMSTSPSGEVVIARPAEDVARIPEFCDEHKPAVSAAPDTQGSLFG